MKTIEQHTIDKSEWGEGPWSNEPDKKQWLDEATGLPCLAVRHPTVGHWCGYVGVSKGHPLFEKDDATINVSVHGGLNFSSHCGGLICHDVEPGEDDHVWWLGFDCGHAFDLSPGYGSHIGSIIGNAAFKATGIEEFLPIETYRTLEYVEAQCRRLSRQLKEMK